MQDNKSENIVEPFCSLINNQDLRSIFKDLVWSVIRFKDNDVEAMKRVLREYIDHLFKYLFQTLNEYLKKPSNLEYIQETNKEYSAKLTEHIFPELRIYNTGFVKSLRRFYKEYGSDQAHEINPQDTSMSVLEPFLAIAIKASLLLRIIYHHAQNHEFPLKNLLEFEQEFPSLKNATNKVMIASFSHTLFTHLGTLLIDKQIITRDHINNSAFLQQYYPHVLFEEFSIENVLNATAIFPFRADGPHVIDFEKGNWVYHDASVDELATALSASHSVIVEGTSAFGKTTLCRGVGYKLWKEGRKVYYLDCIKLGEVKLREICNQMALNINQARTVSKYFIIENVHVLDRELQQKLGVYGNHLPFLSSRRTDFKSGLENGRDNRDNTFGDGWNRFLIDERLVATVRKNIIDRNVNSTPIKRSLESFTLPNLWVLAMIIRFYTRSVEMGKEFELFETISNVERVFKEITELFREIIHNARKGDEHLQHADFLNNLIYLLAIFSLFSTQECWLEEDFLDILLDDKNAPFLHKLHREKHISKEVIESILFFLIKNYELRIREYQSNRTTFKNEFMIPHAQIARIYKHCVFDLMERDYRTIEPRIIALYILNGRHYGSWLLRLVHQALDEVETQVSKDLLQETLDLVHQWLDENSFQDHVMKHELLEFWAFERALNDMGRRDVLSRAWISVVNPSCITDPRWKEKIADPHWSTSHFLENTIKHCEQSVNMFIPAFRKELLAIVANQSTASMLYIIQTIENFNYPELNDFLDDLEQVFMNHEMNIEIYIDRFLENQERALALIERKLSKDLSTGIGVTDILKLALVKYRGMEPISNLIAKTLDDILNRGDETGTTSWEHLLAGISALPLLEGKTKDEPKIIDVIHRLLSWRPRLAYQLIVDATRVINEKIQQAPFYHVALFLDILRDQIEGSRGNPVITPDKDAFLDKIKQHVKSSILPSLDWIREQLRTLSLDEYSKARDDFFYGIEYFAPDIAVRFQQASRDVLKELFARKFEEVVNHGGRFNLEDTIGIHKYDPIIRGMFVQFVEREVERCDLRELTKLIGRFTEMDAINITTHPREDSPSWDFSRFIKTERFKTMFLESPRDEQEAFARAINANEFFRGVFSKEHEEIIKANKMDWWFAGIFADDLKQLLNALDGMDLAGICAACTSICMRGRPRQPAPGFMLYEQEGPQGFLKHVMHHEPERFLYERLRSQLAASDPSTMATYLGIIMLVAPAMAGEMVGSVQDCVQSFEKESIEFIESLVDAWILFHFDIQELIHWLEPAIQQVLHHASQAMNLLDYRVLVATVRTRQGDPVFIGYKDSFDLGEIVRNSTCFHAACSGMVGDITINFNHGSRILTRLARWSTKGEHEPIMRRGGDAMPLEERERVLVKFMEDADFPTKLRDASFQVLEIMLIALHQHNKTSETLPDQLLAFLHDKAMVETITRDDEKDLVYFFAIFTGCYPRDAMGWLVAHETAIFKKMWDNPSEHVFVDFILRISQLHSIDPRFIHRFEAPLRNMTMIIPGDAIIDLLLSINEGFALWTVETFMEEITRAVNGVSRNEMILAFRRHPKVEEQARQIFNRLRELVKEKLHERYFFE